MTKAKLAVEELIKGLDESEAAMVRQLMGDGLKIPPQPRVVEEFRQLLLDDDFTFRQLAKVINQDPGLVAMLFKICKGAAFRRGRTPTSVEDVLQSIGVKQTFNLVQAATLAGMVEVSRHPRVYEAYWTRSQAVAQLAMLIAAERITVCNIFPDQAYLAAIFHDCGVPLLMQRFPNYCAEMNLENPGGWIELAEEDRKFSADHCVVGYLISRHWNLPEFICDAIRNHHEIRRIGMHASRSMVAILQMAVEIYYHDLQVDNPEWIGEEAEVLEELGIHPDDVPEFIDVILERFHEQQH